MRTRYVFLPTAGLGAVKALPDRWAFLGDPQQLAFSR